MSTLKINWGTRILFLYVGFMALIILLVTGSMNQSFDLVTPDYYGKEVKYQQVIDAAKNQSVLSAPVYVYPDSMNIIIDFPSEFKGKELNGVIKFYSPVNASWDKDIPMKIENNSMIIPRTLLHSTTYTVELSWEVEGKHYYQSSEINIH